MTASLKHLLYKTVKNPVWILSFSLCFIIQILFLPASSFACALAFQEITPRQLRDRLLSISENKKKDIQNMNIESCGPGCLSFYSSSGIQFKIEKDLSISEPEIVLSSSSKTLKIPSTMDWPSKSPSNNYLKSWLVGSELHPYTNISKNIQHTEAQNTALNAFKQALKEGVKNFLHISPTSTGKALVLAQALKEKLQSHRKISLVTVHLIHLVDQLFDSVQKELRGMDVTVINWNRRLNKDFYLEIERAAMRQHPTVFVITTQSLKGQLNALQNRKPEVYDKLVKHTDGIYMDEAHHLGAPQTKQALLTLQERSGAFLYGATATPAHREVNIRDFFEREHWSYLNGVKVEDLFKSYPIEKIMEQLSLGISRGEVTPFDSLHIIGESSFRVASHQPVFIQNKSHFRVLNPYYYNRLAGILHPILISSKKGFIVTATIAEANRLNEVFK